MKSISPTIGQPENIICNQLDKLSYQNVIDKDSYSETWELDPGMMYRKTHLEIHCVHFG